MRMEKDSFLQCRNEILEILKKHEAEKWNAVRILSSAMNETLAPDGDQAVVILRPLLVYHEVDDKI